jgi:hypothetical protein
MKALVQSEMMNSRYYNLPNEELRRQYIVERVLRPAAEAGERAVQTSPWYRDVMRRDKELQRLPDVEARSVQMGAPDKSVQRQRLEGALETITAPDVIRNLSSSPKRRP